MHNNHCHRATAYLQSNILLLLYREYGEVGIFVNEVQQEVATAWYSVRRIHWLKAGRKTRKFDFPRRGQSAL